MGMDDDEFEDIMDDFFGSGDGVAQSEGSMFIPIFDDRGQMVEEQEIPFMGGFRNIDLGNVRFPQAGKKDLVLTTPKYERHICPNCNTSMDTEKTVIKAILEQVLQSQQPQPQKPGAQNMASPRVNHKANKDMKDSVSGSAPPEKEQPVEDADLDSQRNALITFMVGLSATLDSFETRYSFGEVMGEDNELISQFFTLTVDIDNNILFIAFNNSELSQDDSMFIADVSITITKFCFRNGWTLKLAEPYYNAEEEEEDHE